jgi:hypothetical protein
MRIYSVQGPDGRIYDIEGPEGASEDAILSTVRRHIAAQAAAPKPESGFIAASKAGLASLKSDVAALAGRTGLMDEAAANKYIQEQEAYRQKTFKPTETFGEAPVTKTLELFGGSLPYMAAPVAAGVGALAAPSAAIVAPIAAGLTSAAQFTGSNLSRQMAEGKTLGQTELGSAAAAAIPQAALDVFAFRLLPGIRGIFAAAGKEVPEKLLLDATKQSVGKITADYTLATGKAAGMEGLTEAGQQVLERLQAGLAIDDEKARDEYFDSFVGGAVLGGALAPAGRYVERSREQGKEQAAQRAESKRLADEARAIQAAEDAKAQELLAAGQRREAAMERARNMPGFTGVTDPNAELLSASREQREAEAAALEQARLEKIQEVEATQFHADPLENQRRKTAELAKLGEIPEVQEPAPPIEIITPEQQAQMQAEAIQKRMSETPAFTGEAGNANQVLMKAIRDTQEKQKIQAPIDLENEVNIIRNTAYSSDPVQNAMRQQKEFEKLGFMPYVPIDMQLGLTPEGKAPAPAKAVAAPQQVSKAQLPIKEEPAAEVTPTEPLAPPDVQEAIDYRKEQEAIDAAAAQEKKSKFEGFKRTLTPQEWADIGVAPKDEKVVIDRTSNPDNIGINAEPIAAGGKPFATRKEAMEAKNNFKPAGAPKDARPVKLDNYMVVKGKEGYVLSPKVAEDYAREKKAARRLSGITTEGREYMNSLEAIVSNGGLRPEIARETPYMNQNPRIGGKFLFQKNGLTLERAGELLMQDGYPLPENYTVNDVLDLINNPKLTPQGDEAFYEAEMKQQERDRNLAELNEDAYLPTFEEFGYEEVDIEAAGLDKVSPKLQAEVRAIIAEAESMGIDLDEMIGKIYDEKFKQGPNVYYRAAIDAVNEVLSSRRGAVSETAGSETKAPARSETEEFELKTETADEVRAKQAEAEKRAAAEEKAFKEEEAKAKADAEVGEFTLTGSNRPADVAASQGQKDIFAASEEKKPEPKVEKPAPKAEKELPPVLPIPDDYKPIKGRHPQVVMAARELAAGRINKAQYDKYVDAYKPIAKVPNPEPPLTTDAMARVLTSAQKKKINPVIPAGTKVGLRMDINALNRGDALGINGSVVAIHPENDPSSPIGYASAAHITDVQFVIRSEKAAMKIAMGKDTKKPQQTAEGTWKPASPGKVYADVMKHLDDPAWTQVSLDPLRHSYFYDRETRKPVLSADEVFQIGRFLLAKNVKFGEREDFMYMKDMVERNATPAQIKEKDDSVKQFGGDVIYQDGDIGVYRNFNLNYEPIYRAFKKDNRILVNIEDYTGKIFSEEEKTQIKDAIDKWKTEDAARYKNDPFVKFDQDGVAFSQSISPEIAGIFAGWKKMLKLDSNIYLTTVEDTAANRLMFTGEQATIGAGSLHEAGGYAQRLKNGDYVIAFKPKQSKARLLEVLAHELGHIHEKEVFNDASKSTKDAIKVAYSDWLKKTKGMSASEYVQELRARATGKTTVAPDMLIENVSNYQQYWSSFAEWYADQVSKWATTQQKPLTVVEKFFAKLGAAMKAFYAKLRGSKYLPNETFKKYLDRVTDAAIDATPDTSMQMPLVSDQMELNFMKETIKAKAQEVLQTRAPMNVKAFEGLDEDVVADVNKNFFAPNLTIIDRMEQNKSRAFEWLAQKTVDEFRSAKTYSPMGHMQASLSKDTGGALENLLYHGHVTMNQGALDVVADENKKGFIDSVKPLGQELDRWQVWMALSREANLPEDKRSSRLDDLVAKKNDFVKGTINGRPRAEVYEQARRDVMALNKSVLNVALMNGLIDRQAYQRFSNDMFYIPFYRAMEDGQLESIRTASRLSNQQFSKMLKGQSDKPFGDLMENTLRNWSHILSASMKNLASNTILEDAREQAVVVPALKPGMEWRTDADGKNGRVVNSITGNIVGDGKLVQVRANAAGEDELVSMTESKPGSKDIVKTQVDGVTTYHHIIDPLLLESVGMITELGPRGLAVDIMRPFKDLLRFGVTMSPTFKAYNLIRESIQSAALSDLSGNLVKNVYSGLYDSGRGSPIYRSALAGGAVFNFGTVLEGDRAQAIKKLIDRGVDEATILDTPEKVKSMFTKSWRYYEDLGNKAENANRIALYKQLMESGKTHLEASFAARDLLNFSASGSSNAIRFVAATVPFFNARAQGLYKLGRDGVVPTVRVFYNSITGKEIDQTDAQKTKSFVSVTGAVALASIALYLANKDDEDFKKREQWDRDAFWWGKIPGTDIAIRVPKPFETGAIATLVERTVEQMVDKDVETSRFTDSLGRMVWQTFSMNPVPQLFKPMVDIYANKNPFTSAPIETAGMERLSKQERKTDSTSPIAVALGSVSKAMSTVTGESTELSPIQIDYMIRAYMGWLGGTIAASSGYAVQPFNDGVYPDVNKTKMLSLGFIENLPTNQSTYLTDFYQNNKKIQQAYADMRHYAELGQSEKVLELLEEKGTEVSLQKFYDKTSKNLANIRQQIQMVSNPAYTAMTGEEKKDEINRLRQLMSSVAEQAEAARKAIKKQAAP